MVDNRIMTRTLACWFVGLFAMLGVSSQAHAADPSPPPPSTVPAVPAGAAAFRLLGLNKSGEIRLSTSDTKLDRKIVLEAGSAPAGPITLQIEPLLDEQGVQHEISIAQVARPAEPTPAAPRSSLVIESLPAQAQVQLALQAVLPLPGVYETQLTALAHPLGSQPAVSVPIRVVRTEAAALVIEEIPTKPVTVWPICGADSRSSFCCSDAELRVHVRSTSSVPMELVSPKLRVLTRKGPGGLPQQAMYRLEFLGATGTDRASSDEGSRPGPSVPGSPSPLRVLPGGHETLGVRICGLPDPGEYTGTLVLGNTGGATAEKTISLQARQHWLLALAIILIGVLISHVMRYYVTVGRPRFVAEHRIARVRLALRISPQAVIPDWQNEVRARLVERLAELTAQLDVEDLRSVEQSSRIIEQQVQLYLVWTSHKSRLERVDTDTSRPLLDILDGWRQVIESDAPTPEEITKALTDSKGFAKRRDDLIRTYLVTQLNSLGTHLQSLPQEEQLAGQRAGLEREREQLVSVTRQSGDVLTGLDRFRGLFERYLTQLIASLSQGLATLTAMDVTPWRAELVAAAELIKEGSLQTAFEMYQKTQRAIEQAKAQARGPVEPSATAGDEPEVEVLRTAASGDVFSPRRWLPKPPPDPAFESLGAAKMPEDILRSLRMRDALVSLAVLVIASLTGIRYLWLTEPTWGGLSDWLTCLLWGLGLHQVSGVAVGNGNPMSDVRDKLTKPPASSPS